MTNTEKDFQATLELDLNDFEVVSRTSTTKESKFKCLYDFLPKMDVGKVYRVTDEIGWDATKDFDKHSANLLYNIRKNCKGYAVIGMVLNTKVIPATDTSAAILSQRIFAIKCLKKPAELRAIPDNFEKEGEGKQAATEVPSADDVSSL